MNTKTAELILYIARRSEDDDKFGKTKLNKLLFFADFWSYGKLGSSITGERYRKLEHGPAIHNLSGLMDELQSQGDAAIVTRDYFGREQHRLVAMREPDLSVFSGSELSIVNAVLEKLEDLNAADVSDLSHKFAGWKLARMYEEIPYSSVFVGNRRLTEPEREYGYELAAEATS